MPLDLAPQSDFQGLLNGQHIRLYRQTIAINATHADRGQSPISARMIPGSDAGVSPGKPHDVLPYALEALVDGIGMTAEEALRAATSVAASAIGLQGSKGRIATGADADLLVVRGNPLVDIGAVRNVEAVFRAGVRVS